jgi:hypothetical protein
MGYRMNTWIEQGILDGNRLHIVGKIFGNSVNALLILINDFMLQVIHLVVKCLGILGKW